MEDKETYNRLRKSLDSLKDVALAEIELIQSEPEKIEFANFVTERVKGLLKKIAAERQEEWKKLAADGDIKVQRHVEALSSAEEMPSLCPPGFVEVDGICVRL